MTLQHIIERQGTEVVDSTPEVSQDVSGKRITVARTFALMQTLANAVEKIGTHYRDIPTENPHGLDVSLDEIGKSAAAIQKVCAELKAGNR
jgi:uncharacterized protein YoxC